MSLSPEAIASFQKIILDYYQANRRSFSWRDSITPYRVVVSEIMLQQTQAARVEQKFDQFIGRFPDFHALASAPFEDVLRYWKGLGYNSRALRLQKIAQLICDQRGGIVPADPASLQSFPGIGAATASSICAFAFNSPTVFIETNNRTVFIYFFFSQQEMPAGILDKDILVLVQQTLYVGAPREWYYALMDYGVMLKKTVGNLCRMSKHYAKQSRFEGSDRQIRGAILDVLLAQPGISELELVTQLSILSSDQVRIAKILSGLQTEGFLMSRQGDLFFKQ